MNCPNCNKEVPYGRKMCPKCFHTVEPIPVPPGGKIRFGGYEWYVLDKRDGKALILTEKVIEKRGYHDQKTEVTWEMCNLRKYLNGDFYESFSASDRARIIEETNKNNDNPWYGTSGGNSTTDRIFLLSIDEVVRYFGDSGLLKTKNMNPGCDWCKDEFFFFLGDQYNFARLAVDDTGRVAFWWLRSPGANARYAAFIYGDEADDMDHGDIDVSGGGSSGGDSSDDDNGDGKEWDGHMHFDGSGLTNKMGVRPALWLRTE